MSNRVGGVLDEDTLGINEIIGGVLDEDTLGINDNIGGELDEYTLGITENIVGVKVVGAGVTMDGGVNGAVVVVVVIGADVGGNTGLAVRNGADVGITGVGAFMIGAAVTGPLLSLHRIYTGICGGGDFLLIPLPEGCSCGGSVGDFLLIPMPDGSSSGVGIPPTGTNGVLGTGGATMGDVVMVVVGGTTGSGIAVAVAMVGAHVVSSS